MRNLMGRLNARSDEELQRISIAWLLPGTARDRAGLIAQLMRAMTDLRSARDVWMRRSRDEQEMIALFVESGLEQGMTISELAERFGLDEAATRVFATRLYQIGVLATAARQQPLAVGEQPRLFLPRELSQLFARIQDELDAGDLSQIALPALMELLDDADIQRAGSIWGMDAIPGLRTRRELAEGLLEALSFPDRRVIVESKLGWDARRILEKVGELPNGQVTSLTELAETLDLDPDHPRTAQRLRGGMTELEEALLVWHTFLPEGGRGLFQPIWQPALEVEPAQHRQLPPTPVNSEPELSAPVHPAALAWDLLSLLRWLGAGSPNVASLSSATQRARRRFNELLWNRGRDEPISGYLEFLAALADHESLLDLSDASTQVNRALRAWRDRSFSEQTARLVADWLGSATWIEAMDQEEVVVTGAHWPQFRRRLLVLLPELDAERWYRFEDIARWLAQRSGDALGETVQIATARPAGASLDRSMERLSSLEQVIQRTLRGAFAWLGLVEVGHIPAIGEVVRVTETGLAAAGVRESAAPAAEEGVPLAIHPDLTITLRTPSPVRIWSLTAFSEQVRLYPEIDYRITSRSLKRALAAGFRVQDVLTFLERQSGEPLSSNANAQLMSWAESLGRVWLAPALVIQAEQDEETGALRQLLESAGLRVTPVGETLLVEGGDGTRADELARRVEDVLQQSGKAPQFRRSRDTLHLAGEANLPFGA